MDIFGFFIGCTLVFIDKICINGLFVYGGLEEEVDYAVTNFMIGDSLVFDFGEAKVVQDHFTQIGGVKVRLGVCVPP